jgi:hypothetical protein
MQGYQDPPELRGVIPNSFDHIFENVKAASGTTFLVSRISASLGFIVSIALIIILCYPC